MKHHRLQAFIIIFSSSTIFCLVLMYHVALRRAVISSNPNSFCFSAKVMLHNRSLSCCTYCHSNHIDRIKASESMQKMYFIVHHKEARLCVLLCKSLCHFCKSSFKTLTDWSKTQCEHAVLKMFLFWVLSKYWENIYASFYFYTIVKDNFI